MGVNLLHSINYFKTDRLQRVQIAFQGRYMLLKSNEEYSCRTFEMSPGEVSLFAPVVAMPGERVVLYLNELGRFTGAITRHTETGFEMSLQLTPKKRDRLADQLTWYANRSALDVEDRRRHDRVVPLMDLTVLRLTRGDEHIVRIRTLSLSGVAIETDHIIPLGAEVTVGNTPAKVVRILDDGVACEFVRHFRPGEIDETTRL
ncbi:PilZ domain-containing protein [Methylocystis parvus]|uniref:PilZ domain-containing protein n=2 Tax=Methylocystis parvus TaxID=134 RepID=A0A6B8MD51_9HYPH|nr:PilZ domain-containing protein [Methylocystis parvus]